MPQFLHFSFPRVGWFWLQPLHHRVPLLTKLRLTESPFGGLLKPFIAVST